MDSEEIPECYVWDFAPADSAPESAGVRVCPLCGSFLTDQRADAVFCSSVCRVKMHRGERGYTARPAHPQPAFPARRKATPAKPDPLCTVHDAVAAGRVLAAIMEKRRADLPPIVQGALMIALDLIAEEWGESEAWAHGGWRREASDSGWKMRHTASGSAS